MVIESDIQREHYNFIGHIQTQKLKQVRNTVPSKKPPVPKANSPMPTPPRPPRYETSTPSSATKHTTRLSPTTTSSSSSPQQQKNVVHETLDYTPLFQFMEATVLKQARLVKFRTQKEEKAETVRHEQELLELWQTTIDAEEEAEHLETKLQLAVRIIDVHEKMIEMDQTLSKAKTSIQKALTEMEPLFFHTRNQTTSIALSNKNTDNPGCTYADLTDALNRLKNMVTKISSQPLVSTETTEFVLDFIHLINENAVIIEKNITEIESLQLKKELQDAAIASKVKEENRHKEIEAKIEAAKIEAISFDASDI